MRCPHCDGEAAYPTVHGPYFEPKVRGELILVSCPYCEKFIDVVAIPPTDVTVRLVVSLADEEPYRRAA